MCTTPLGVTQNTPTNQKINKLIKGSLDNFDNTGKRCFFYLQEGSRNRKVRKLSLILAPLIYKQGSMS